MSSFKLFGPHEQPFNKCPFLSFLPLTNNPTLKRHFNNFPFLSFLPLTNNPTLKKHFNKCPFFSFLALTNNPKRTLQQMFFFNFLALTNNPTLKRHFNKCPFLSFLPLTNNPTLKRHFNKCPFSIFLALANPKRTLQQVSFFKLFRPHEPQKDTSTSVLFEAFWLSRTTPKRHFNKCPLLNFLALTNNPKKKRPPGDVLQDLPSDKQEGE